MGRTTGCIDIIEALDSARSQGVFNMHLYWRASAPTRYRQRCRSRDFDRHPIFVTNTNHKSTLKLFHLRRYFQIRKPDLAISFLARVNTASAIALLGQNIPLVICERTWPPFASLAWREAS